MASLAKHHDGNVHLRAPFAIRPPQASLDHDHVELGRITFAGMDLCDFDIFDFLPDTLEIIVVEHYPIEERDNLILSLAQTLGLDRPVRFFSSLEDPLFREFGSDRYVDVLNALSKGSTQPITGNPISDAIRVAQRKIQKKAVGDQYVSSPEEWFAYNIRRGLSRKSAAP